jgi:hypothetical protein
MGTKENAHYNILVTLKRGYNTEGLGADGKIL